MVDLARGRLTALQKTSHKSGNATQLLVVYNVTGPFDDAQLAKRRQLGVIEGAGHVVHDEKLGGIAALVAGFLQSCESTTR